MWVQSWNIKKEEIKEKLLLRNCDMSGLEACDSGVKF